MVFNNFNFHKFNITDEEFNELSADTKYRCLQKSCNKINEFRKVKYKTAGTKKRKVIVNDAASRLFNEQIGKLDNKCNKLSNAEKK